MSILDLTTKEKFPEKRTSEQLAYDEYLSKPVKSYSPANVGEIPGTVKDYYNANGGGVKGTIMGIVGGLGKVGEVLNTSTGKNLMAGITRDPNNPYLASAYAEGGKEDKANETAQAGVARTMEQNRINSIGELVKQQEKERADYQRELDAEKLRQEGEEARSKSGSILALMKMQQEKDQFAKDQALKEKQLSLEQQKFEKEFAAKPEAEKSKSIIDSAQQAFNKGQISAEDLAIATKYPNLATIKSRGLWSHLIPFMKTSSVVVPSVDAEALIKEKQRRMLNQG